MAAVAWGLLSIIPAGLLCGFAINEFGELGSCTIWLWGIALGAVAARILGGKERRVGALLVVNVVLVGVIAETCYLHWNFEEGSASWGAALSIWPLFVKEYKISVLFLVVFIIFGSGSALRSVSQRYVMVAVE